VAFILCLHREPQDKLDIAMPAVGTLSFRLRQHGVPFCKVAQYMFVLMLIKESKLLLLTLHLKRVGYSLRSLGLLNLETLLVEVAVALLSKYVLMKYGLRFIAVTSLVLKGVGMLVFLLAQSMPGMVFGLLIFCVASGLSSGLNLSLNTDFTKWFVYKDGLLLMGFFRLFNNLGPFVGNSVIAVV